MAEGKSAIPAYNYLIVDHFLSFSDFTPHFTPHNFLSIMAFKGHGSFISGVTDAVCQSALDLVRGGWGLKEPGLRLSDRGSTMGWQRRSAVNFICLVLLVNNPLSEQFE